jgi:hypothetical protein
MTTKGVADPMRAASDSAPRTKDRDSNTPQQLIDNGNGIIPRPICLVQLALTRRRGGK